MTGPVSDENLRLLRLRFLRPPPTWIQVSDKGGLVPVELAVGVTDDYGGHAEAFEALTLQLQIVDYKTLDPISDITISVEGHPDGPSQISLSTSRGPFHQLKLTLNFTGLQPSSQNLRFLVSKSFGEEIEDSHGPQLSKRTKAMLDIIGQPDQVPVEGWDGNQYLFMKVYSGEFNIRAVKDLKGKAGSTSSEKVQTALRTIHFRNRLSPIFVVERPGLNNSTGQRLWDCAVGISCFLQERPDALLPNSCLAFADIPEITTHQSKRRKLVKDSQQVTCVELGAGCSLASLAASVLEPPPASVIATDVQETFSTTMKENIEFNQSLERVRPAVLDWGLLSEADIAALVPRPAQTSLMLLGTDILYNPSSHPILLETVSTLLRLPNIVNSQFLLAYKPRTEGDDGFFELAREAGLNVEKVWSWGDVHIYRITPPTNISL
ncbi:hypothetical protein T439DRAFT_381295 [Meredithblackwellia eburnea MCA 4105]